MKERNRKFIRILNMELDDLIEDIEQLIRVYREKCEKGELTNYVYLENKTILDKEITCLKSFGERMLHVELDRFQSLEELSAFVDAEFKKHLKEGCYMPTIGNVIERKLQKVLTYVKS